MDSRTERAAASRVVVLAALAALVVLLAFTGPVASNDDGPPFPAPPSCEVFGPGVVPAYHEPCGATLPPESSDPAASPTAEPSPSPTAAGAGPTLPVTSTE